MHTYTILVIGLLICLASVSSKIFKKFEIPGLLFFLSLGMVANSESIALFDGFNKPLFAKNLGDITLILILFFGGSETHFNDIKPTIYNSLSLSTIGIIITTFITGLFTQWVMGFGLIESLLIGAILSSTDAAAVFSILKSKNIKLKNNLAGTLELESGSNDAMAFFLTELFLKILTKSSHIIKPLSLLQDLFYEMCMGSIIGVGLGILLIYVIKRIKLPYQALYPTLTLGILIVIYSLSSLLHANTFLAVYIIGLCIGDLNFHGKRGLLVFYDSLVWGMQIFMFIVLGLLVTPNKLFSISIKGLLIALLLTFVARPVSVFSALIFSRSNFKQKIFLSWVGLKGAVPIIFATYPLLNQIPAASEIFHIVFFIVIFSVLVQGTTLDACAKALDLKHTPRTRNLFDLTNLPLQKQKKIKILRENLIKRYSTPYQLLKKQGIIYLDSLTIEKKKKKFIAFYSIKPDSTLANKTLKQIRIHPRDILFINRKKNHFTGNWNLILKEKDLILFTSNSTKHLLAILNTIKNHLK